MHHSLAQKSSNNTRTFTIHEYGVSVDAKGIGTHSSKKLRFSKLGPLRDDFDITHKRQVRFSQQQRIKFIAVCFALSIALFSLSAHLEKVAGHMSPLAILTDCLGWLSVALILFSYFLQSKSLRCKRIYFESGSMEFFYRNEEDADQINSFLVEYDLAERAYTKQHFMAELEKDPTGMERWLESLHERGVLTSEEYKKYRDKIQNT